MEFEGTVYKIMPVTKGTSARGEWQRQDVVFEMNEGSFTRKICVTFFNKPDDGLVGKDGKPMQPHTALCLETQFYPDSVHHENFPFQYLQPGVPFSTTTEYRFSVK